MLLCAPASVASMRRANDRSTSRSLADERGALSALGRESLDSADESVLSVDVDGLRSSGPARVSAEAPELSAESGIVCNMDDSRSLTPTRPAPLPADGSARRV